MAPQRIEQTCAGGVVVRRQPGGMDVCLVFRTRHHQPAWGLPKGHQQDGESLAVTALREVREETGLVAQILEPLGSARYQFALPDDPATYEKTVHFFLMRATGGSLDDHDAEVEEARWMPLDQALAQITHANEREMVRAAAKALSDYSTP